MEETLKCRCDEARSAGKLARCVPNLGEERLVVVKYGHSNSYFLIPWSISVAKLDLLGFWSMIDFLFELGIGFFYVWYVKALDWE
jgi:hypothetical protein